MVILNDQRPAEKMQTAQKDMADLPVTWVLGDHPLELLAQVDLVCISGGVPLTLPMVVEAQRRGIPLSNDSQIFMEEVPCPVIGITGSAGKTTTTTLVGRMAEASELRSKTWVGGNIGLPLIDQLEMIKREDLVILELSSFQLELMSVSPQIGAVLNITPNHLDRHRTMKAYLAAKARLLDFQSEHDFAVLGMDDPGAWSLAERVHGKLVTFGLVHPPTGQPGTFLEQNKLALYDGEKDQVLMPVETVELRGSHNLLNVLAACAILYAAFELYGKTAEEALPVDAMKQAVSGFNGVPHRLEFIRAWKGVDWYNDSIATAPERTLAAVRSFSEPLILLLGGRDKDLPWEELAEVICQRVNYVIVFGEAAGKILEAIKSTRLRAVDTPAKRPFGLEQVSNLHEAVLRAAQVAEAGDVVLLSPGATSFDSFRDFEERGEAFRTWVNQLS